MGFGGLQIQTPKGHISGPGRNAPTTTTNAGSRMSFQLGDIDDKNTVNVPQTPGGLGGKVPSLDMSKVGGSGPGY